MRIDLQNTLFATFEELLEARIEAALAAGSYDVGVETLNAESFRVVERRTVYTHAATATARSPLPRLSISLAGPAPGC